MSINIKRAYNTQSDRITWITVKLYIHLAKVTKISKGSSERLSNSSEHVQLASDGTGAESNVSLTPKPTLLALP